MTTRLIFAALTLAAGSLLFLVPGSDATAQAPAEPGHAWCFSQPYFNVQATTCVELPVAVPRGANFPF